jgi:hypothetical protein
LENFKRLHADGVISVGAIVTRGKSLHDGMRELIEQFAIKKGSSCGILYAHASAANHLRKKCRIDG